MRTLRNRFAQLLVDAAIIAFAFIFAYAIRFDGDIPSLYRKQLVTVLPYLVVLRLALFGGLGVYRIIWRYVTVRDLPRFVGAVLCGSGALVAIRLLADPVTVWLGVAMNTKHAAVPWSIVALELMMTLAGITGARVIWRIKIEESRRRKNAAPGPIETARALLIGAGEAGVMVARELKRSSHTGLTVVGFVDDNPEKAGKIVHGFPVVGRTEDLPALSLKHNADTAIITIGNAPAPAVRRIVELAEATSMRVQTIPKIEDILSGRVAITKLRDVDIEDLLRREPITLEKDSIEAFITGKTVLVTGGGGSIGSEICRQVGRFKPKRLYLLDKAETSVFHVNRELRTKFPDEEVVPLIGDVTDETRMRQVFEEVRPDVVFHAAAFKHVPLMEANPGEAVRNNVGGSRLVAELTHEFEAQAFVMISTDKAVKPSSVMGVTKRIAELFVQSLARESKTRFLTVRFGNVLGSAGSVVPLFKEEIAKGGPVHVTHPDMKRYFMSIPEASQLVLQSAAMGAGGEIFVLEMGQPIRIVDLARDLIRLSGYIPEREIEIAFSGIRPGEKLSEEISLSEENATKTQHPRIWIGQSVILDLAELRQSIDALIAAADHEAPAILRRRLEAIVPEYTAWLEDGEREQGPGARATKSRLTGSGPAPEASLPSSA